VASLAEFLAIDPPCHYTPNAYHYGQDEGYAQQLAAHPLDRPQAIIMTVDGLVGAIFQAVDTLSSFCLMSE
jgi:hypothetical protein